MNEELLPYISLVGERTGRLKELSGFRKPTLGQSGSQSTSGLGSEQVTKAGEELFAAIRPALGYKRKDIALSQEATNAVIACRDFEIILEIAPHTDDPDCYHLRKTVSNVKSADFFVRPDFNEVFGSTFQRLELRSKAPVQVEDWIDRVEARDLEEEWQLRYPSDYSSCTLRLPRSEFEIQITPERLVMTRLLPGTAQEFWEGLQKLSPVLNAS